MQIVLAWFRDRSEPSAAEQQERAARFDAAARGLVPESYLRHDLDGRDCGLTVLHVADSAYRWPVLAREGPLAAASLGIPIGLETAGGPIGMARRLLAGDDVHAKVVPPFGLLALDGDRKLSIQQDWLGMSRIFTAQADGITAFCNRPGLLAAFLGMPAEPDLDGWASYAVCGHFGADLSPLRGVRLLSPGERIIGERADDSGWRLSSQIRYAIDGVVADGMAARAATVERAIDLAAEGLTSTATGIYDLYDGDITLGLSGGKDSRVIAASFIAAGRLPRLHTNDDLAAEGETARRLVAILAETRGLRPRHQVAPAAAPAAVLHVGLRDRVAQLQRRHDFQFPSTFSIRPAVGARLPEQARGGSVTGAGGELAVGYWYPTDDSLDDDRGAGEAATFRNLLSAVPPSAAAAEVSEQERARVRELLAHGEELGLRGMELVDYVYLVERVRRWYTSAYFVGMVTPFLAPGFVAASFAVTPAQKRARVVHNGLLRRFLPEWAPIPYVTGQSGTSAATRVWDGDGLRVVCDLLDTAGGRLTGLLSPTGVERAAMRSAQGAGTGTDQKTLQQFAWLAVAAETLEPAAGRPATGAAYARVTQPPRPPRQRRPAAALSAAAGHLRFIRRTRLGRRVWDAVRARSIRG